MATFSNPAPPGEIIDALIAGHQARTFMMRHADEYETGLITCKPCMNRVGLVLRGATLEESTWQACAPMREAAKKLTAARQAAFLWNESDL